MAHGNLKPEYLRSKPIHKENENSETIRVYRRTMKKLRKYVTKQEKNIRMIDFVSDAIEEKLLNTNCNSTNNGVF